MISAFAKLDELTQRKRDGATSYHATFRVDGVPFTRVLTAEQYAWLDRATSDGVPLVMTIGPESST